MPDFRTAARIYFLLTKPGIVFGNAVTALAGFAIGSKGPIDALRLLAALFGLSLIVASACVLNNYIDRRADAKMVRTKDRPLATGAISIRRALLFAALLAACGTVVLALWTNLLTLAITFLGFFIYVAVYSFVKYRSMHGTLIGSAAGAVPPLAGYCAASGQVDIGALLLFAVIALWQMPHFFAIAVYRLSDYAAAAIPVLPLQKGLRAAKVHILLYIGAFLIANTMLAEAKGLGVIYWTATTLLGLVWLALSLQGFWCEDSRLWARRLFLFSLVVVMGLSAMMIAGRPRDRSWVRHAANLGKEWAAPPPALKINGT